MKTNVKVLASVKKEILFSNNNIVLLDAEQKVIIQALF